MILVGFSACKTNDTYDSYGDYPPDGTYGSYGYDPSAYPPPSGGAYGSESYGTGGNDYSESGEVLSIPGDGSGSAAVPPPSYSAPTPAPATPSGQTYTVVRGDNLYRISQRFGTSVPSIKEANGLTSTVIHPGQQLIIPQ